MISNLQGSGMPSQTSKKAQISQIPFGAGTNLLIAPQNNSLPLPQMPSNRLYPNLNECAPFSYIYPNQLPPFMSSTRDYVRKVIAVNPHGCF